MHSPEPQDPPKWPIKLIKLFLRPEYVEEMEGDMYEEYQYHLERFTKAEAKFLYIREIYKVLRSSLIKNPFKTQKLNAMGMIANYSKVTIRNIRKNKVEAAIKIGGFSIGIAITLFISLFVLGETNKDSHLEDTNVYRVVYQSSRPEQPYRSSSVPPVLAPSLKKDYPEIIETGRILVFDGFADAGGNLFRPSESETSIYEEKFGYADQSMLQMLQFKLIQGDVKTALEEPFSMILSASKAEKYFPGKNPVGQTVFINEDVKSPYTIKGVYQDLDDSHLSSVDFFFSLAGKEFWENEQTDWCCYNYVTYLELSPDTRLEDFENKLKSIHDHYFLTYEIENDPLYANMIEEYNTLNIQHVSDIYLYSQDIHDFISLGDIRIVSSFSAIAVFILLLACVNFVNLATANSAERAMEIGLRKVVGSGKRGIINQFLVEAVILSFVSVAVGVILALLAMPSFSQLVGEPIEIPIDHPGFYALLFCFSIVIGLLSGTYPAFYLSGIKTVSVLGGKLHREGSGGASVLRNVLVVFQFAISMFLISGAIVVFKQMDHILSKDLGFDKEQIMMIHGTSSMEDRMLAFKNTVSELPEVLHASFSNSLPVEGTRRNGNGFWKGGSKDTEEAISGQFWRADDDYFSTLGLELLEGRAFSNEMAGDTSAVVINQEMAAQLGLEDPLNAVVENWRKWKVVGVVKDFNFDHLSQPVRPLLIARTKYADILTVKLKSEDLIHSMAKIEKEWQKMNPNQNIRVSFLDHDFEAMYDKVIRTKNLFMAFAVFAVFVACLGLIGLTIHTIAIRTKEITVRKVLGASVPSILGLLSQDYIKLILVAIFISVPVGWYLADAWLREFTDQITTIWDAFLFGSIILTSIAFMVISFQCIKAAKRNPALGLRAE